eukprot:3907316-Rhodomonas_salina.1
MPAARAAWQQQRPRQHRAWQSECVRRPVEEGLRGIGVSREVLWAIGMPKSPFQLIHATYALNHADPVHSAIKCKRGTTKITCIAPRAVWYLEVDILLPPLPEPRVGRHPAPEKLSVPVALVVSDARAKWESAWERGVEWTKERKQAPLLGDQGLDREQKLVARLLERGDRERRKEVLEVVQRGLGA